MIYLQKSKGIVTDKTRAQRLRELIKDGLLIGFSASLIGNYTKELSELEKSIRADTKKENERRKARYKS